MIRVAQGDRKLLHIGKASFGWCFSLRVYPDRCIHDWDGWEKYLANREIVTDEDESVTLDELREIVLHGDDRIPLSDHTLGSGTHTTTRCTNGLRRHTVDGRFCVGHGQCNYDLVVGEFR